MVVHNASEREGEEEKVTSSGFNISNIHQAHLHHTGSLDESILFFKKKVIKT